jgi:hypothetical protein
VRPGAATEIAEQANILLNDPTRRSKLRDSGIARLRLAYSPDVQRFQLLNLFRELLPSFAPAPVTVDPLPLLSVVIPVRNEERHIGAVLDKLLEQDYPRDRIEIIVADGNSTDGTAEVVKRYAASNVIYAPNPAQLSSAGRNVGVNKSRGDIIVFIDGHCEIPSRTLLSDTVELLAATRADCLARPQPLTVDNASLHPPLKRQSPLLARASSVTEAIQQFSTPLMKVQWIPLVPAPYIVERYLIESASTMRHSTRVRTWSLITASSDRE